MFCRAICENAPKCAIEKAYSSKTEPKPNQTPELGQNTSVGVIQVQPATHQSKAVVTGLAQGAAAPMVRCGRTSPSSARSHLALAVHSMLGETVACGAFLKYMSN